MARRLHSQDRVKLETRKSNTSKACIRRNSKAVQVDWIKEPNAVSWCNESWNFPQDSTSEKVRICPSWCRRRCQSHCPGVDACGHQWQVLAPCSAQRGPLAQGIAGTEVHREGFWVSSWNIFKFMLILYSTNRPNQLKHLMHPTSLAGLAWTSKILQYPHHPLRRGPHKVPQCQACCPAGSPATWPHPANILFSLIGKSYKCTIQSHTITIPVQQTWHQQTNFLDPTWLKLSMPKSMLNGWSSMSSICCLGSTELETYCRYRSLCSSNCVSSEPT